MSLVAIIADGGRVKVWCLIYVIADAHVRSERWAQMMFGDLLFVCSWSRDESLRRLFWFVLGTRSACGSRRKGGAKSLREKEVL